ncbi:PQQ-dependent sugar dehydrogenase [Streptomyces evansiae]|uniref:PQQ-dependent sugar dehydrogenase n=1 Tax=Streptomyces evansiae TaxID=3075535 RepID=UPI0028849A73|nr:PQQ-dependent sugar dehydrogenase [Streptomyces sp. DSM 41859]MDT0420192.1 PQQ-dependent sugar dehydrogenase [Streptomyces sp. DSM 41859]
MRGIPFTRAALATAGVLLLAGCSSGSDGSWDPIRDATPSDAASSGSGASGAPRGTASASASAAPAKGSVDVVRTVAEGLKAPWALAPLPEDGLLVSSRDNGQILQVDAGSGKKTLAGTVPGVVHEGEGGLLGLAVSPGFATDHLVYAYFTTASDNRVARMLYDAKKPAGQRLGAPSTVLRGIPKGVTHNGGRIAFGPDGMLYIGTGETGDRGLAQDRGSLAGKILRVNPDGTPARGNPDPDSPVWSWGHRNVQGFAWDPEKHMWASEFGQDTWDELNLIEPGKNYGWPDAEGKAGKSGFTDPLEQWRTADASPSGVAWAEGSVWLASLRGERLWRVPLKGTEAAAKPQAFLKGEYGRLRAVVAAGGDKLWLLTNETDSRGTPSKGDDKILELRVK